ncbi:Smr/MutS family protein [Magnetospira thiophila]
MIHRPPPRRRSTRGLSREDHDVWHFVTRDVAPLRAEGLEPAVLPPPSRVAAPPEPRPRELPDLPRSAIPLPEMAHGSAPGLDRRTAARMRRGKIDIQGRLDLHGMTRAQAHGALRSYLMQAQLQGKKCVLVITGRGLKRDGEIGVLRQAVPEWLNDLRGLVHAFHYAAPQDGGEGALYVLLRRVRPS